MVPNLYIRDQNDFHSKIFNYEKIIITIRVPCNHKFISIINRQGNILDLRVSNKLLFYETL